MANSEAFWRTQAEVESSGSTTHSKKAWLLYQDFRVRTFFVAAAATRVAASHAVAAGFRKVSGQSVRQGPEVCSLDVKDSARLP